MKTLLVALFMVASSDAYACRDFTGIFHDPDAASCLENRQTGCERLLQTVHFKTARPITTDFITDGALRRYPVERSMRKAIRYDAEGRQVFLGLDDQNGRIDGLYTRRGDGNIHALTVWTSAEGEAWEFESLLTEMPTLDECKSRL